MRWVISLKKQADSRSKPIFKFNSGKYYSCFYPITIIDMISIIFHHVYYHAGAFISSLLLILTENTTT
jgi:hypothetical protein